MYWRISSCDGLSSGGQPLINQDIKLFSKNQNQMKLSNADVDSLKSRSQH